jgi:PAP2 superfamily
MTPPPAQNHCIDATSARRATPRERPARRWPIEILLFAGALIVYQLSRAFVIGDAGDAVRNAWDVIDLEKASGIFFESSVQRWMLDNLHLAQFLNHFYVWAHLPVTAAFFVWLYRSRRAAYPFVRNAFFVANGVALAVFVVFPVAPPRLMTSEGFIDTLSIISGIDLHAGSLSGWFNPFAAVPSMHFGYALMIGVVVTVLARHWVVRILALTYPLLVFVTIVGTANHYVLDALAGGAVMLAAFGVTALVRSWRRRSQISVTA